MPRGKGIYQDEPRDIPHQRHSGEPEQASTEQSDDDSAPAPIEPPD